MTGRWMPAPPAVTEPGRLPPRPPGHRVKVLHVITRLEAGAGGNTLVSALGMDRQRYEVWIAAGGRGPLWERADRAGIRTVRIPEFRREVSPARDAAALVRLVRLIRAERFAIVHVHEAKAGLLGRLAAALCGTPVVVITLHGRDPWWRAAAGTGTELRDVMPGKLWLYSALERTARPLTDAFVAVAPTVARDAVQARVAAPGRTDVAASAVDLDAIPYDRDPSVRAELGIPAGDQVVGMVGRLDPQKAPLDFIRMAVDVAGQRPGTRFVVTGDGELEPEMRRLAQRLGIGGPLHRLPPGCRPARLRVRRLRRQLAVRGRRPVGHRGHGFRPPGRGHRGRRRGGCRGPRGDRAAGRAARPRGPGDARDVAARPPRGGLPDGQAGPRPGTDAVRARADVRGA